MKHYRFTNTGNNMMETNNSGLTFQQWIDQIDEILHKHFGITHVNINRDWEYHWLEADDPAVQADHVMSIDMPHTYAAHTNTYYSQ